MNCCVTDLHYKEVINSSNGMRLGNVCDVEVDTCNGRLIAIVIFGTSRCFGLFGKTQDIRICWEDIEVIGEDTILVKCCPTPNECCYTRKKRQKFFEGFMK